MSSNPGPATPTNRAARADAKARVAPSKPRDDAAADAKADPVATRKSKTSTADTKAAEPDGASDDKPATDDAAAAKPADPTVSDAAQAEAAAAAVASSVLPASATAPEETTSASGSASPAATIAASGINAARTAGVADADAAVLAAGAAAGSPVPDDADADLVASDGSTNASNMPPANATDKAAEQALDPGGKPKAESKTEAALAKMTKADAGEPAAGQGAASTSSKREQPGDGQAREQAKDPDAAVVGSAKADAAEKGKAAAESTFDQLLDKFAPAGDANAPQTQVAPTSASTSAPTSAPAPLAPEHQFARDNVENVVTSVKTQMSAGPSGGGQMRIRLDPPELGALEVAVKMVSGRMTASFTTSNDHATQLLSHSLDTLKSSLEASGISVDRIQVRQSGTDAGPQQNNGGDAHQRDGGNGAYDPHSRQGDQQRREAVNKMWRKLAYGSDEVDIVA